MESQQLFVGLILAMIGGMMAVRPDVYLRFQVWIQKRIMGAKYEPSDKTTKFVKFMGVVLVILGLMNLVGGL